MSVKPEPVPQNKICSVCGLEWKRHPQNQNVEATDCVKLLLEDLTKATQPIIHWTPPAYPYGEYEPYRETPKQPYWMTKEFGGYPAYTPAGIKVTCNAASSVL